MGKFRAFYSENGAQHPVHFAFIVYARFRVFLFKELTRVFYRHFIEVQYGDGCVCVHFTHLFKSYDRRFRHTVVRLFRRKRLKSKTRRLEYHEKRIIRHFCNKTQQLI